MTISSDPRSAIVTLDTIRRIRDELGGKSILGVSNISFGLPARELINSNFLTMAMTNGLSCAIINPCNGPMSKPDMIFNWPLETTWMMIGLATSGVFEKYPDIKFVTHHCGAMIPVWHNRVFNSWFANRMYVNEAAGIGLDKSPEEYFLNLKKFYNDTALYGESTPGLAAGIAFFGTDHILFGTDAPLNGVRDLNGQGETGSTIHSIEALDISDEDKQKIFCGNAKVLIRL